MPCCFSLKSFHMDLAIVQTTQYIGKIHLVLEKTVSRYLYLYNTDIFNSSLLASTLKKFNFLHKHRYYDFMLSATCNHSWTWKGIHKKPKVKSTLCFNFKFLHTVIHLHSCHSYLTSLLNDFHFLQSNFLPHKPVNPGFSMIKVCV